eukprot:NODE_1723_length_2393_cov_4.062224.p1 GENE.NODE_1723_length_2393_cov_4.062224~~NODE_1723_length_2393_cov_4.062224.p1  ORF type:complete len:237 (+),score=60.11 NODE_1723_length_2393_cov_4.062224:1246-1956(+)
MPAELWGVVDVHGTVKSVRLARPSGQGAQSAKAPSALVLPAPPVSASARRDAEEKEAKEAKEAKDVRDAKAPEAVAAPAPATASKRSAHEALPEANAEKKRKVREAAMPSKRPRLPTHSSCGCMVHLMQHTGSVVHVPEPTFVIGRKDQSVNLRLNSKLVPSMISAKHARISCTEEGVMLQDLGSTNGTWLNGVRVAAETDEAPRAKELRHGDVLVLGTIARAPAELRFTIALPQA